MTFYHLYEEAMANLVPKNAKDAKVKALATTIKKVQATEIARMSGWLVGGGIPAPVVQNGVIIGHTMATMGGQTKAMTTKPEIAALGKAKGQGFDRMWLTLMIRQHEGAAVTAKSELARQGAQRRGQTGRPDDRRPSGPGDHDEVNPRRDRRLTNPDS